MKKIVVYKILHYRKDGSLVSDTWKLTQKEYEFYKIEMPRRVAQMKNCQRFDFVKIKPEIIEYSDIPGF